ncbi:hypothetical protein [Bradyrhizobium guangdongense]|uniref:hypothetical protein n=1 Tax=Bradyrhizobium guangdongense TaxID=1325090 RepID=UPI0016431A03|nr:hypothetical protein [Bradyrhizobium guangdongense]
MALVIGCLPFVIPGRAKREPGIHFSAELAARWIPGSTLRVAPIAQLRNGE